MDTLKVGETRKKIEKADEIRLLCPHCHHPVYVQLTWPYLRVQRTRSISRAIEEHRRLCTGAPPEAGRVYRIDYPRA